jgi:FlaA1/EpsC-like NDP-sugar epimerase
MAFAYKEPAISPAGGRALRGLAREVEPGLRRVGLSGPFVMMLSLVLADALAAQAAFYFGAEVYAIVVPEGTAALGFIPHLAVLALALPIGYCLLGVYRVAGQAPIERFPLRIKATCVLFALLVVWHYAAPRIYWPLGGAALTFAFAVVLPLIGESITRTILIRRGLWGVPAVVIGAGPTGQQVVRILQQMPELGLRPVGFFDDRKTSDEVPLPTVENVPVLGSIADSASYSRRIETAIVTTPAEAHRSVGAVAMELGYRNIIVVPDLRELPTLWVRARDLNGLIGLQMRRNQLLRRNRLLKQTNDHLVALTLAIASAPIVAML